MDKPAPVHAEFVLRGDEAIIMHRQLDTMTPDARDRTLRSLWRKSYDYVTPTTVAAHFDLATGAESLSLEGTATLDWQDGALELANMQLGASVDFTREPGPDFDAPFTLAFPHYDETRETIVLPDSGRGFTLDPLAFDRTIAGLVIHREGSISDGIVSLAVSRKSVASEFSAKDALAAQQDLRRLSHQHIYLRRANMGKPS